MMKSTTPAIINDVDIAICGAGPAGQALALLLHKQGIAADRIALFDGKTSAEAEQDARTIALSAGSQQILEMAGSWPVKATPINEIHVSRRGHFGRSLINADDYAVPALGYVARYGDIIAPMQKEILRVGIRIHRPLLVSGLDEVNDHVRINLHNPVTGDHSSMSANVVVQAEGGTFSDQSARTRRHDYQQTAIIAHVTSDQPLPHRAFERFTEQGPLALLPQENGYALVWCVRPDVADTLCAADDVSFKQALQKAFGNRIGQLQQISARVSYPLGLNAQTHSTARTVSIGNAAQTLHPVAGQGLNLGLRDTFVLARCLSRHAHQLDHPAAILEDFIRQRQADRGITIRLTDTLARVFASTPDGSLTQSLLGLGLSVVDICNPARDVLAGHMMYGWR